MGDTLLAQLELLDHPPAGAVAGDDGHLDPVERQLLEGEAQHHHRGLGGQPVTGHRLVDPVADEGVLERAALDRRQRDLARRTGPRRRCRTRTRSPSDARAHGRRNGPRSWPCPRGSWASRRDGAPTAPASPGTGSGPRTTRCSRPRSGSAARTRTRSARAGSPSCPGRSPAQHLAQRGQQQRRRCGAGPCAPCTRSARPFRPAAPPRHRSRCRSRSADDRRTAASSRPGREIVGDPDRRQLGQSVARGATSSQAHGLETVLEPPATCMVARPRRLESFVEQGPEPGVQGVDHGDRRGVVVQPTAVRLDVPGRAGSDRDTTTTAPRRSARGPAPPPSGGPTPAGPPGTSASRCRRRRPASRRRRPRSLRATSPCRRRDRASPSRRRSERSSLRTPVDVSAWTRAIIGGDGWARQHGVGIEGLAPRCLDGDHLRPEAPATSHIRSRTARSPRPPRRRPDGRSSRTPPPSPPTRWRSPGRSTRCRSGTRRAGARTSRPTESGIRDRGGRAAGGPGRRRPRDRDWTVPAP